MSNQNSPPQLSLFAKKYGFMSEDDYERIGLPRNRSGLTPVTLHQPVQRARWLNGDIIKYQRRKLRCFTSKQLQDLDCLTTRSVRLDTLNGIHAIFSRDRWETDLSRHPNRPFYTLNDGSLWIASNPRVWSALEPALRLLTRMVNMLHEHPWFETLLTGTAPRVRHIRYPPLNTITDPGVRNRINSRSYRYITARKPVQGEKPEARRTEVQRLKNELLNKFLGNGLDVKFGIHDGSIHPVSNQPRRQMNGIFVPAPPGNGPMIFLARQSLVPLLRDDLTLAEAQFEQYRIATILFHELMHACFALRRNAAADIRQGRIALECFYEDEQVREIGWSAENALFGGATEVVHHGATNNPNALNIFMTLLDWPLAELAKEPTLINPKMAPISLTLPVKLIQIENTFSSDYWDAFLRTYGIKMLAVPATPTAASWKPNVRGSKRKLIPESHIPRKGDYSWEFHLIDPNAPEGQLYAEKIRRVSELTPEERTAYAQANKVDILGKYQVMSRLRDRVHEAQLRAWEDMQNDRSTDNIERFVAALKDSAQAYEVSLAVISRGRQVDPNLFKKNFPSDLAPVRQFLTWLDQFRNAPEREMQDAYQSVNRRVSRIRRLFQRLDQNNSDASLNLNVARYTPNFHEQEAFVVGAEDALAAGNVDMTPHREQCEALIMSLLCRTDLKVRANILIASLDNGDLPDRMRHLDRARNLATAILQDNTRRPEVIANVAALRQKAEDMFNELDARARQLEGQVEDDVLMGDVADTEYCGKKRNRDDMDTDLDEPASQRRRTGNETEMDPDDSMDIDEFF